MATTFGGAFRNAARSMPSRILHNGRLSATARSDESSGPFGAALADDIFKLWDDEMYATATESSPRDPYNEPLLDGEEPYQLDLGLENQQQLEDQLRNEIRKFKRGYHKMMVFALQWHYLMEECADNPQLEKMFKDLQLIRKLTGSEAV